MRNFSSTAPGFALVFSFLVLVTMFALAVGVAQTATRDHKTVLTSAQSIRAFQLADTGMETALNQLYKNNPRTLNELFTLAGMTGTNPCAASDGVLKVVNSTSETYEVRFYYTSSDGKVAPMNASSGYCTEPNWRKDLAAAQSTGISGGTVRAIKTTINPVCKTPKVVIQENKGGTLTDVDYDTIAIGNQCWMQQNLNVGTFVNKPGGSGELESVFKNSKNGEDYPQNIAKMCYGDTESGCDAPYGGLYSWDEMMQNTDSKENLEGSQGICPTGWHIPTDAEWHSLELFAWNNSGSCDASRHWVSDSNPNGCNGALDKLTSLNFGTDKVGNYYYIDFFTNPFIGRGNQSAFWTSTNDTSQSSHQGVVVRGFGYDGTKILRSHDVADDSNPNMSLEKSYAHSVRCIQNQ
jgi:uncharacterized protein (TIGR02145 family)